MKQIHLTLLSWLFIPILLAYISINYLLSNVLEPRWHLTVSADNKTTVQKTNPTPTPIPSFNWNGEGLVTFWFDDAWLSQYETALPILKEKGYTGSIAVPTQLVGYESYMNWYQIRRTQFLGWEITSHSQVHNCEVDKLSALELKHEVEGSKEDLIKNGAHHDIYVLPCGAKNENVTNLIAQNYKYLRTVERGLNPLPVQNKNSIKIVEVNKDSTIDTIQNALSEAKETKSWIILVFHQISDETSPFAITPDFFQEVVAQVKMSNLRVVRPSEALQL